MPDISMCKNEKCTQKERCFRFMAKPNEYWQSYSEFEQKNDECGSFISILEYPKYYLKNNDL